MHRYTQALKVSTLALTLSFGLSYVYAWNAPAIAPTGGNVSAPINTGTLAQTKTGDICTSAGGGKCLSTAGAAPVGSTFLDTSSTNQTKVGDIAISNAAHFLDTGTTIPSTPAGGTAAVAANGWPNYSDVAANAVKLAGLTSADILAAQTAPSGGMGMFVNYGDTTCPTGWSVARTGKVASIYSSTYILVVDGLAGISGSANVSPTGAVITCLGAGSQGANFGTAFISLTANTCAVCVK